VHARVGEKLAILAQTSNCRLNSIVVIVYNLLTKNLEGHKIVKLTEITLMANAIQSWLPCPLNVEITTFDVVGLVCRFLRNRKVTSYSN